jgi:hypothetical protein
MPDFNGHIVVNPLGWAGAGPAQHVIGAADIVILAVTADATLASVGWRFYRGVATVRAQLRWLLAAGHGRGHRGHRRAAQPGDP